VSAKAHTTSASKFYTVVADHDQLLELTVTQEQVDAVSPEDGQAYSIGYYLDSEWTRLYKQFFRERVVHVRSNNVLLLRFQYTYEVDLDRIKTERDLLGWVLQLVGKPWTSAERVKVFADAVAEIKGFNIHLKS
jgi:hypothetical protein